MAIVCRILFLSAIHRLGRGVAGLRRKFNCHSDSDGASGQPVGTQIVWTARAAGAAGILPQYKFSITPPNGSPTQLLRDYSPTNTLRWTSLNEGTYQISVRAADAASGAYGDATTSFVFTRSLSE
jgi:hypothetical protein